jgi:hypothetical protein
MLDLIAADLHVAILAGGASRRARAARSGDAVPAG